VKSYSQQNLGQSYLRAHWARAQGPGPGPCALRDLALTTEQKEQGGKGGKRGKKSKHLEKQEKKEGEREKKT